MSGPSVSQHAAGGPSLAVGQVAVGTSGSPVAQSKFDIDARDYGVLANGVTRTDGIISGNQLSFAGASFAAGDVGKLVVIPAAGTPTATTLSAGLTTGSGITTLPINAFGSAISAGGVAVTAAVATLSAGLSTGAPITSLPITGLASAVAAPSSTNPAISIMVSSGTHSQIFAATSATAGAAASMAVTSATPNFAYPIGSTVTVIQGFPVAAATGAATSLSMVYGVNPTSTVPAYAFPIGSPVTTMIPALSTTISSVLAGVATLAASAGTNIAQNAEVFYASDDTAAVNAAIAATPAGGTCVLPLGHIGLSAAIAWTTSTALKGRGVYDLWGGAANSPDSLNFAYIAPYLQGTVLVQCAANTDILQPCAVGNSQHLEDFGLRFAGKFMNTGHGINTGANLPVFGGGLDQGPTASRWRNITGYGVDGNHYTFDPVNCFLHHHTDLRSYGGGGYHFTQSTTICAFGNTTINRIYNCTFIAGTAHGIYFDAPSGIIDYTSVFNPQSWVYSPTSAGLPIPNTVPPNGSQKCWNVNGTINSLAVYNPDMETNCASTVTLATGRQCVWTPDDQYSTGANKTNSLPRGAFGPSAGLPVSGTSNQNLYGNQVLHSSQFVLNPAAAATQSTTLSGNTAYLATVLPVAAGAGFAAGMGIQIGTAGSASFEYKIISSVAGNNITLTSPCLFAHSTSDPVLAGAAVVIAQVSATTLAGNTTTALVYDWVGVPIGDTQGRMASIKIPHPNAWFMRLDWANATLANSLNGIMTR